MRNRRGPLTPDEQERLERFLEWRRAAGRVPGSRWRWIPYVAGALLLGVSIALGASFLIASLTGPPSLPRGRVVSPPEPGPVERATAARSFTESRVSEPPRAPAEPARAPVWPERPSVGERPRDREESGSDLWRSGTAGEIITMLRQPPSRPDSENRPVAQPSSDVVAFPPAPASSPPAQTPSLPPAVASSSAPPAAQEDTSAASPGEAPSPALSSRPGSAPTPPLPVTPPAPGTPYARPAASTPSTARPGPMPEVATKPLPQPLETLKRWAAYAPEVRVGRAIIRWVKSQSPADSPPPEPRSPQSR